MYFLTRYLTSGKRIVCVIAAIVYMFNPFVVDNMLWGQVPLQAAYALIPLMLLFFIMALDRFSLDKLSILFSASAGILLALISSLQIQYGYIGIVLLALWIIAIFCSVLIKKHNLPTMRGIAKFSSIILITGSVAALFRLNFVIQALFGSMNVGQIQIRNTNLWYQTAVDASNQIGGIQNTIRLRYRLYSFYQVFEDQTLNSWHIPIELLLAVTFIFVILVFAAIFLYKRNRSIIWFTLVVLLFAYLSAGTNTPVNLFGWLFQHAPGFYIFREPSKFFVGVALGSSFLFGLTVSRIYEYLGKINLNFKIPSKHKVIDFKPAKMLTILLLFALLLPNVFPLAQGDFGGFHPTTFPAEYQDSYNWLSSQSGDFRVLILPLSMLGNWSTPPLPIYGPGYGGLTFYNSPPQPIVFQPTATSLSQGSQRILYYLENLVYTNQTHRLASLLSILNVKYVVVAPLSVPSPFDIFSQPYSQVLTVMKTTPDFLLVHSSGDYFIFENVKFGGQMYGANTASLAFGNLDLLGDLATEQQSTLPALVYGYNLDSATLSSVAALSNDVIIQGNRFIDYVLQSIDNQYLITLASHVPSDLNDPKSSWILSTAYTRPISDVYASGEIYSNSDFVFTNGVNNLSLQYQNNASDVQQIWIRSAEGPEAGCLQISMGSNVFPTLSLYSQQFQGFQWRLVGNISIGSVAQNLSIKSLNGTNLLDSMIIVPSDVFQRSYSKCITSLEGMGLTFVIDSSTFTNIAGFELACNESKTLEYVSLPENKENNSITSVASLNLTIPFSSDFDLLLEAQATAGTIGLKIIVDNNVFNNIISASAEVSNGTTKIGSIRLSEGIHSLSLEVSSASKGNLTFYNLQLVKSSINSSNYQIVLLQPNFDSFTHATIHTNISKQMFLIYSATYDPDWKLQTNNAQLPLHVEVNGFANCWFIPEENSKSEERTLDLSFNAQTLVNDTIVVDVILLVVLMGGFIFTLNRRRIRQN
jgi:hypothetical protein